MKHTALHRIIIALSVAAAAMAGGIDVSAANIRDFRDMAPYVYPNNFAKSVARPYFTADGSCLKLTDDGTRIVKHDLRTGTDGEVVMDVTHTRESNIKKILSFTLSPDGSKLLVAASSTPIYRRSTSGTYYVYELRTRVLTPLSETHPAQRAPLFSPDGRMVAFVATEDNNIYLKKIDFGTETAVTTDGAVGSVINGVPDWVYEEEFSTDSSMAWSPDSRTLCYIKYDESQVPVYTFPLYEGACDPKKQYALYPGSFVYKYPVAGEPNSKVSIHSYDIDNRTTRELALPSNGDGIEYIPRITFGKDPSGRLLAVTLNRNQTRMEIFSINPRSGVAKSLLVEESEAWINPVTYEQITYLPTGFVLLSSRSGFCHAYVYSYEGQLSRTVTSGNYDVKQFYGADAKGNFYFQTTETGAINRVVVRVDPKGVSKRLSPDEGTGSAWFSSNLDTYALTYSNAATPPVCTLYATQGDKKLRVLEDNAAVASKYSSSPKREFMTLTTAEGVTMDAYMVKPPVLEPGKKYPVIISQYSGPGSQEVLNRWVVDWEPYAAMKGYIVLCVDPRGTGGKGREWETSVYKNLGHYEGIDLRGAARRIAELSYVDAARIGICGWSYGGYQSIMSVSAADSPFACAVAIAPVTDWRYYDTVYAERYMLTPGENDRGYKESAPINHVADMNIPLLLMHGTADDNVHLMNTIEYVSVIQSQGKFCDMFLYPNMNHSIYGCDSRLNVYSRMLDYFDKNL